MFSTLEIILLIAVGVLGCLLFVKHNRASNDIHNVVHELKAQIHEEQSNFKNLEATVEELRKEFEVEREEKYQLREEVSLLRLENKRLREVVADLERVCEALKTENERLLGRMQDAE